MTVDQAVEYADEGYDFWEAVYRSSDKPMRLVPTPVDGRPDFACFILEKRRRPFSAAWRKLCVLVDAGAMKCTAGLDDPLAPREVVPPGALIHFHLAENPPEQNIGQVVLEGPNGRRLYDPRFVDCRDEGTPITAGELINYYEAAHVHQNRNWLFEATIKDLAEQIYLFGRRVYPRRWTREKNTLARELKRRRSRERRK